MDIFQVQLSKIKNKSGNFIKILYTYIQTEKKNLFQQSVKTFAKKKYYNQIYYTVYAQ